MSWIEEKYLSMISSSLDLFKTINLRPLTVCFRCPYCGDSQKKKSRRRGYIFEKNNNLSFYCHNCSASSSFVNFLKDRNQLLYNEYQLECLREKGRFKNKFVFDENQFKTKTLFEALPLDLGLRLDNNINNAVSQYVEKRKIPEKFWISLYSCEDVNQITSQIPRYQKTSFEKEQVLVIPFYNSERKFSYMSCRTIENGSSFRYLVFEIDDLIPKIWGLEFLDCSKTIYVTEGFLDSMMIENGVALSGASNTPGIKFLSSLKQTKKEIVFVYDFDMYSNLEIQKQVHKRINEGFSVFIPSSNLTGVKDLNDIIMKNILTFEDLNHYIQERTFSGLRAKIEFVNFLKNK